MIEYENGKLEKVDIDELLKNYSEENLEEIIEFSGIKNNNYQDIIEFYKLNKFEIKSNIMKKIENSELYSYFLSRLKSKYYESVCELMTYSSKKDDIREIINNRVNKKIPADILRDLIISTDDPEFIKSFIEDPEKRLEVIIYESKWFKGEKIELKGNVVKLILATKDFDYIKSFIEDKGNKLNLNYDHKITLIIGTENFNYIKQHIDRSLLRLKVGLKVDVSDIKKLIKGTRNPDYIMSIIENVDGIRELLDITKKEILDFIVETRDEEFIMKCIDKAEDLGFNEYDITHLIIGTNNQEYIEKHVRKSIDGIKIKNKKKGKVLKVPEDMTIGIEIESEGKNFELILKASNIIEKKWCCKKDNSLENGAEVVSPILTGNNIESSNSIKKVCQRLRALKQKTSENCRRTYPYWS